MPEIDWQLIAAVVIVATAFVYLANRVRRWLCGSGRSGCGSCSGGSSSAQALKQVPLVTLEPPANNGHSRQSSSEV